MNRSFSHPVVSGAAWGSLGGAVGALIGHLGVLLVHRWTIGDANYWLKGPHGPPFFDLAVSNSFYYAALGAALFQGRDRLKGFGIGFASAFLILAAPLWAATRLFRWGEDPNAAPTLAWFYLVLGSYGISTTAACAALGRWSRTPASWLKAAGAVIGGGAAYLLQLGCRWAFPSWGSRVEFVGLWAPPSQVYAGALWGGCIGIACAVASLQQIKTAEG